jgi:hypothetical protein
MVFYTDGKVNNFYRKSNLTEFFWKLASVSCFHLQPQTPPGHLLSGAGKNLEKGPNSSEISREECCKKYNSFL